MTTIQESPRPTVPIGQAVGQAEASLTKLLAGELVSAGLVWAGLVAVEPNEAAGSADGGTVRLTSQGVALRAGILGASAKITEPMLATIDRDDLETTVRTLNEITRRARGIPARPVTTEETR